jgi:hypothetical protein
MFSLLLTCQGMSNAQQKSGLKRKQSPTKGRIIGYSRLARLRPVQGRAIYPPHDEFLFLIEQGNDELKTGQDIKIRYRFKPQHYEDLPPELFAESSRWTLILERDETCDESTVSFIYGSKMGDAASTNDAANRFPNLARLRGAENISLPKKQMLRCYSFDRVGIEK